MRFLVPLFTVLLLCSQQLKAQDNIHIVAVANGDYPAQLDSNNRPSLPSTNWSAGLFLNALKDKIGATSATILRSDENLLVSKGDVKSLLDRISAKVRNTEGDDLVVFYYIGHGFGEGTSWRQYLLPGDRFLQSIDMNKYDAEALEQQMISVAEIVDTFDKMNAQFIILIDTCYEGTERNFSNTILEPNTEENLNNMLGLLRFMNQFRGPNPVIFASKPGSQALTVPYPNEGETNPEPKPSIGPIARRVIKYLNGLSHNQSFDIRNLVTKLLMPTFDPVTNTPLAFPEWAGDETPITQLPSKAETEIVYGTSKPDDVQTVPFEIAETKNTPSRGSQAVNIQRGRVDIVGTQNEYVSDGSNHQFDLANSTMEITKINKNAIVLDILSNGANWSVAIAGPEGKKLKSTAYRDAIRYDFQGPEQNGLEISGDGRGCGELTGSFVVEEIIYEADKISKIKASFLQYCDEAKEKLTGQFSLEF